MITGLTTQEAGELHVRFGFNEITAEHESIWRVLLRKFWAPVPWMLEAATILTLVLGHDIDAAVIFFLLVFNAVVAFLQEGRAERALALLQARLQVQARVLRDDSWQVLAARELVPGDVVHVRMGDVVPADIAVASGSVLVDEAALTGEAVPVEKGEDQTLYAASVVGRGEASGRVTATAKGTYFGRTTELVNTARTQSHLEHTILGLVRYLLLLDLVLIAGLIAFSAFVGTPWSETLPFALIVLVGSIPVALPATFTLSQALGAQELSGEGVLATRLSAIEEAASMDILCSDKTGTLTQNKLTVGLLRPISPHNEEDLLAAGAAASDAATQDPLDLAILAHAKARGVVAPQPRSFTPFDPATKETSAEVDWQGAAWTIHKGAPQVLAPRCQAGGPALTAALPDLAGRGYRVLAVSGGPAGQEQAIGLIGLEDPPRPDSARLIADLAALGVGTRMVTGDTAETAQQMAGTLGIGQRVHAGRLGSESGSADSLLEDYDVFAGVFPEDKYELVRALQARGHVVGMTGDGVNDAPALKQAEVGIAVESATDVAKAAASLVLTTPGLGNVVQAVVSSRRIYQRMQTYTLNKIVKTVQLSLFLTLGFFLTRHFVTTPHLVVLLLFANDFVTMSIATDRVTPGKLPARWNLRLLVGSALAMGLVVLVEAFAVLYLGLGPLHLGWPALQSLVFLMLVFSGLATVLVVREPGWFWQSRPSRSLAIAMLADVVLVSLLAHLGWLMTPLSWTVIGLAAGVALIFLLLLDVFQRLTLHRVPDPAPGGGPAPQPQS